VIPQLRGQKEGENTKLEKKMGKCTLNSVVGIKKKGGEKIVVLRGFSLKRIKRSGGKQKGGKGARNPLRKGERSACRVKNRPKKGIITGGKRQT